jgi:hypothetical protein
LGPGTKLLGVLDAIQQPCYLVLADDDIRYKRHFLQGIADAQQQDHFASFSYWTYRTGGLTVGQGCDGFSFWYPNIADVMPFAEKHVKGTNLIFHDDLWISFWLATKGISIKNLQHLLKDGGTIYETEHEIHSLRYLTGPLSREELNRDGIKRLLQEVDMPEHRKLIMQARAACHRFVEQPSRRVLTKLRRITGHH